MLKRVLGEERGTKGVIPDDAEEHDMSQEVVGKPLAKLTRVVQEPGKPTGEKEKYLTPYSALTAPDCTPDSQQPIDPSKVPGSGNPQKFTVSDLENAPELPQNGMGQSDPSMRAMDTLLGHRRMGAPARNPQEFASSGAVTTEEAETLVQSMTLNEGAPEAHGHAAAALLSAKDGGTMPEPTSNFNPVNAYEAMRRFM
jgi:hypothetical protein